MRWPALIRLLMVVLFGGMLLLPATPSYAGHHGGGRVFIGIGAGTGILVGPSISVLLVSAALLLSAARDRAAATGLRAAGASAGASLGLVLLQKCRRILPTDSKLPGTLDTGSPEESVRGKMGASARLPRGYGLGPGQCVRRRHLGTE